MQAIKENRNYRVEEELKQKPIGPSLQVITPQPLTIRKLHKDEHKRNTNPMTKTTNILLTELLANEYGSQYDDREAPLAARRSQHTPKLSNWLMESQGYLSQPHIFSMDTDTWILRTFNKVMRKPKLWWEPMVMKIEILKKQSVFKLVQYLANKNIVGLKWVYTIK